MTGTAWLIGACTVAFAVVGGVAFVQILYEIACRRDQCIDQAANLLNDEEEPIS